MADWLNYQHLFYFWTAAREGGVSRAAAKLDLAQSTVSGQLRQLERAVRDKLFTRDGRTLRLTETGRVVYRYAEEIFGLGDELLNVLRGHPTGRPPRLAVGVVNAIPALIVHRLLEPVLHLPEPVEVSCYEARLDRLLSEFSLQHLDIVLSDVPIGQALKVRGYNHLLGECGVSFFGSDRLAAQYGGDFPRSLDGAPFLLPTDNTALRWSLEQWFSAEGIHPAVRGEFEDSSLLTVFGRAGAGIFAAPAAVEEDVQQHYGVRRIGRVETIREHYYAISVERKLKHPGVVAISEAARRRLLEPRRGIG
jgi:LysR family transcriptional activator of nhaA